MQKQGEWKPYNVKAIERNISLVFERGDIAQLNKPTYDFITSHMGFIAHYSLLGFQDTYRDLDEFRERLQTSEYPRDADYNLNWADKYEDDRDFNKWYGQAYTKSVAAGIRQIVGIARTQSRQACLPIP